MKPNSVLTIKNQLMKAFIILLTSMLFELTICAQPPIQWQKSLGGSENEECISMQQTADSGYILTGYTISLDGDVIGYHGAIDFWVVKLTNTGSLQWKKALGGSDTDWPFDVCQAPDGGFAVAGYTQSEDGDVVGNHGDKDAWVIKLSAIGDLEWQKSLGGTGWDEAASIIPTSDGGYIMAGRSNSTDGDAPGNGAGSLDFWIVKLNSNGTIQWQKKLGGSNFDAAQSIMQTSDGGYLVIGQTESNDGDVSNHQGNVDFWVVKLGKAGDIEWQNAMGGSGLDVGRHVQETSDGYTVFGYAGSNDGQVTGHHGLFDFWIVHLNKTGALIWQKILGGSDGDWLYSGALTSDNGYLVAGTTRSFDGDVINPDQGQNVWIVKLNEAGEQIWQKTIGGSKAESCLTIIATSDGGFALAGKSSSNDGDVTFNHGKADFWVVKLAPESVSTSDPYTSESSNLEISPNPTHNTLLLKVASEESCLHVCVTDMLGRPLLQHTITNGGSLDVAALSPGFYMVSATTPSGKVLVGKLRKE